MVNKQKQLCREIFLLGDSITQGIGTEKNSYKHWNAVAPQMLGEKYSYWKIRGHPNEMGCDLWGKALAEFLKERI